MSQTTTLRKYGKSSERPVAEQLFAELPRSPVRVRMRVGDAVGEITEQLVSISLDDNRQPTVLGELPGPPDDCSAVPDVKASEDAQNQSLETSSCLDSSLLSASSDGLRVLAWDDVCPLGDRIEKIAEASYAEVYRVTNDRGTSIIKVIRLESPIKPQTKAQEKSGLVDEDPHSEGDLAGELRISEWLADIPGFVVYKERYIVQGKATKALLETHQSFQRKAKRKDPDRLQFYPSPSRYLPDTLFLVVELGDAGNALEDFELSSTSQLWDIFLHTAIALARAEDLAGFEVGRCPI
jgi:serine/threonine-protein kinase haspin